MYEGETVHQKTYLKLATFTRVVFLHKRAHITHTQIKQHERITLCTEIVFIELAHDEFNVF